MFGFFNSFPEPIRVAAAAIVLLGLLPRSLRAWLRLRNEWVERPLGAKREPTATQVEFGAELRGPEFGVRVLPEVAPVDRVGEGR